MPGARARSRLAAPLAGVAVAACAGALTLRSLLVGADVVEAMWEFAFLTYAILGALVVYRRPANPVGWLLLVAGLLIEVAALVDAYAIRAAEAGWPAEDWARWAQSLLWIPALAIALVQIPLRFPTGRLSAPRWRWVSIAAWVVVGVVTVATAFAPGPIGEDLPVDNPLGVDAAGGLFDTLAGAGVLLLPLAVASFLSLRTRRGSSAREHLQLRWFGFSLVLAGAVAAASVMLPGGNGFLDVAGPLAVAVAVAVPPAGIAVAVLRHRLYGIDAIISRSAAYALLSAGAAAVSLGLVAGFSAVVGRTTTAGTVVTAVAVAFGVHGSWSWVQRRVDLAVYGARGDPYRVVRVLGDRLQLAGSVDDALAAAASTLATTLRLPSVSIHVRGSPGSDVVAGKPEASTVAVPVVAQGRVVGELEVGLRRGEDGLEGTDEELIGELARSIGPLCHAAALTEELRRSLERLGQARDEERDRIHRDLHDGIGPTLAGLALRVDILRSRSGAEAAEELAALEEDLKDAFQGVTKLIDGLRPKLLDERGLGTGLADHCRGLAAATSPPLQIELRTDGDLERLPPSVESAAWYITSEALNNVVRHAGARRCEVRLSCSDGLEIVVADDGRGITSVATDRTGLRSMSERARALGGTCTVGCNDLGGTTVRAILPVGAS
jgi:signal transduction histidine kinase